MRRRTWIPAGAVLLVLGVWCVAVASPIPLPGSPRPGSLPLATVAPGQSPQPPAPRQRPPAGAPARAGNGPEAADVGPCPPAYAHLPVVWRGRDPFGRPSWRHRDGSVTLRARQRATAPDGTVLAIPTVVHLKRRDG